MNTPLPRQNPNRNRQYISRFVGPLMFVLPYLLLQTLAVQVPAPRLVMLLGVAIFFFLGFDLAANKFKFLLALVGLALGLLSSYFFAPGLVRMSASVGEWLTDGFGHGYGGTIIGCALTGGLLGLVAGVFMDKRSLGQTP